MSPATARQLFREAVAQIAQKAKEKLPECNGRVEKAVALVLSGDVEVHANGTTTVYSATDPTRRYEVIEGTCVCRDWEQAPHHFCKHRIAAGIQRRVQELLPPVPVDPDVVPEAFPAHDQEPAPLSPAVPPRPARGPGKL